MNASQTNPTQTTPTPRPAGAWANAWAPVWEAAPTAAPKTAQPKPEADRRNDR